MAKHEKVRLTNISRQAISVQVKPPGGDFFRDERQVRMGAGKSVVLPKDYLLWHQITNLKGSRKLRVVDVTKK